MLLTAVCILKCYKNGVKYHQWKVWSIWLNNFPYLQFLVYLSRWLPIVLTIFLKKFLRRLTVKSLRSFFLLHPFVFFLSPSILLQKTCFLHQCNLKFSILSLRKTFVCLYGRDAAVTMRRNTLWRIQSTMDREVNVKKIWYTKTTKIRTTLCQNISD